MKKASPLGERPRTVLRAVSLSRKRTVDNKLPAHCGRGSIPTQTEGSLRWLNNMSGCLCRVPVTEAAVPTFVNDEALREWARREAVDLALDYRNRLSIPLATAYELRDRADAVAASHAAAEADRVARSHGPSHRRAGEAPGGSLRAGLPPRRVSGWEGVSAESSMAAWEAVHKAERSVPDRVRVRLAGCAGRPRRGRLMADEEGVTFAASGPRNTRLPCPVGVSSGCAVQRGAGGLGARERQQVGGRPRHGS